MEFVSVFSTELSFSYRTVFNLLCLRQYGVESVQIAEHWQQLQILEQLVNWWKVWQWTLECRNFSILRKERSIWKLTECYIKYFFLLSHYLPVYHGLIYGRASPNTCILNPHQTWLQGSSWLWMKLVRNKLSWYMTNNGNSLVSRDLKIVVIGLNYLNSSDIK